MQNSTSAFLFLLTSPIQFNELPQSRHPARRGSHQTQMQNPTHSELFHDTPSFLFPIFWRNAEKTVDTISICLLKTPWVLKQETNTLQRERENFLKMPLSVSYPPEEVSLVVELPVLREEDKPDLFYTHVEIISFLRDYQREEKEEEEEEKRLQRQQKLLKRKRLNPRGRPWKRPTTDDGDSQPILPSRTDDDDDDDDQSDNGHDMDSGNPPRPRKRLRRQDATIVPDVPT